MRTDAFLRSRIAHLDAVARERPLTEAEQREVMLRATQARRNRTRRQRYFLDPDYRQACIEKTRAYLSRKKQA
jgi:hypothetical protein